MMPAFDFPVANRQHQAQSHPMHIPIYTGPAAQAARRALGWRRIALRAVNPSTVASDLFESANQFRLARSLAN